MDKDKFFKVLGRVGTVVGLASGVYSIVLTRDQMVNGVKLQQAQLDSIASQVSTNTVSYLENKYFNIKDEEEK